MTFFLAHKSSHLIPLKELKRYKYLENELKQLQIFEIQIGSYFELIIRIVGIQFHTILIVSGMRLIPLILLLEAISVIKMLVTDGSSATQQVGAI
jgi:hypothetical protein